MDKYNMDYIPDKELFKAVMFARKMIREGTPPGIANTRAAGYYGKKVYDVARYVGQTASRVKSKRNSSHE